MKTFANLLTALVLSLAAATSMPVQAVEALSGALSVSDAISRPNLPNRPMAAYLTIKNAGDAADTLVSASSPAFDSVEIHTMTEEEGVMKMLQLDGIEIPAQGVAMLEPGGMHLMLFGASKSYKDGDAFPLNLEFKEGGSVDLTVTIGKPGHGHGDHSGHGTGQTD